MTRSTHDEVPTPTAATRAKLRSQLAALLPAGVTYDRGNAVERVGAVLEACAAPPEVLAAWCDSTFRYYRREGLVDAPAGTTTHATYGRRQVLQAAAAKLAGAMGLLTIKEARTTWPTVTDADLEKALLDAAARCPSHRAGEVSSAAAPTAGHAPGPAVPAPSGAMRHFVLPLPGGAQLLVPMTHAAARGTPGRKALLQAAEEVLRELCREARPLPGA